MDMKHNYVCKECGSAHLIKEASAMWDIESQTWFVDMIYDEVYCMECDTHERCEVDVEKVVL